MLSFSLALEQTPRLTSRNSRQCNMFFTRVVEIEDMILPPKPSPPRGIPRFGQPSFNVPIPPEMLNRRKRSAALSFDSDRQDSKRRRCESLPGKRQLDEDDGYESDEAEVHGLVRVTVVTRRKKIKVFHLPNSGSVSGLAPAREVIGDNPSSSQAKKKHPTSSPPLQVDKSGTAQNHQAYPPSTPKLETDGSGEGSSWLGVNDYSFLPYQSLMARREAEWSSDPVVPTVTETDAPPMDAEHKYEHHESTETDTPPMHADHKYYEHYESTGDGDSFWGVGERPWFVLQGSRPLTKCKSLAAKAICHPVLTYPLTGCRSGTSLVTSSIRDKTTHHCPR